MLRKVQQIAGVLIVVQGAGHSFLGTPMFFGAVSQEAVWFAGAGFAMIFLGLLNLVPRVGLPIGCTIGSLASIVRTSQRP